jgi:cytochrome bd-type quinol oxidase subunit 2
VTLFGVLLAQAQGITTPSGQTEDVYKLGYIAGLIQIGLLCGVVLCLVSIAWSGMQWASAEKDKEKRARAQRRIIWSLVGLLITFFLTLIVTFLAITLSPPVDF